LIAGLLVLGLAVWWWLPSVPSRPGNDPDAAVANTPPREASFEEPDVYDPGPNGRRAVPAEPSPVAAEPAAPAPEEAEAPPGAYDAPLPTLGVEEPMRPSDPDAPPVEPLPSRNTEPLTQEQQLNRAVFWRGMLDGRVEELNGQLATAVENEDEAAQARLRRQIERLEARRPEADQRVEELQQ